MCHFLKESDISVEIIENMVENLNSNINFIVEKHSTLSSYFLFSTLYYYKSILYTAIRSIRNHTECECAVHPEFLSDISYFRCQEDHFYNVNKLKSVVLEYQEEFPTEVDNRLLNLIRFITDYSEEYISFKDYYETYTGEKMPPVLLASSRCLFGQGSTHGCCGNYSGCCWYWHPLCWIHDKMCVNCSPSWFCLPGCKPDMLVPAEPSTPTTLKQPIQIEQFVKK